MKSKSKVLLVITALVLAVIGTGTGIFLIQPWNNGNSINTEQSAFAEGLYEELVINIENGEETNSEEKTEYEIIPEEEITENIKPEEDVIEDTKPEEDITEDTKPEEEAGNDIKPVEETEAEEPEEPEEPVNAVLAPVTIIPDGYAIIGGTFYDEFGDMDWVRYDDHAVPFSLGVPFTARVDLGSDFNVHGAADWGYITVIQTDLDVDAIEIDAYIEIILVDGVPIKFNEANIEVFNERHEGGIRISLTNIWSDEPVVASYRNIGKFSKIEVVMAFTEYGADRPNFRNMQMPVISVPVRNTPDGHAIIGGTFYDEFGDMDWVRFDNQAVPFRLGTPFTARVDLGDRTNIHGAADWGYITVIQTDLNVDASEIDAFIEMILVDGVPIKFNEANIEVFNEWHEGGIRISLTNIWADEPVVTCFRSIGEFSKIEVVMVFVRAGAERPNLWY
jgi:hypothetical protein